MREVERELEKSRKTLQACMVRPAWISVNYDSSRSESMPLSELADVSHDYLLLDGGCEGLLEQGSSIKEALIAVDLEVKRLLLEQTSSPKFSGIRHATNGVKLLKISVPAFEGNIMNRSSFWKQFEVSIHQKKNLENIEKLAYLRDALKDGSAKLVIQGLSQTAGNYAEAIK